MQVKRFEFNPFAENTYVLYDDSGECVIVDPGCYSNAEEQQLRLFIAESNLTPVRLINTHCHIDHVLGINFVRHEYDLELEIHEGEQVVLASNEKIGQMYGIPIDPIDLATKFLNEGDTILFGNTRLEISFTPGHSPASICFYDIPGKQLIAGDVLFQGSIGRTDLPGGDFDTLMKSIMEKLMSLPDDVVVFPGHGPATTIGAERRSNPFILQMTS